VLLRGVPFRAAVAATASAAPATTPAPRSVRIIRQPGIGCALREGPCFEALGRRAGDASGAAAATTAATTRTAARVAMTVAALPTARAGAPKRSARRVARRFEGFVEHRRSLGRATAGVAHAAGLGSLFAEVLAQENRAATAGLCVSRHRVEATRVLTA
jgi:hypothetical protein